MENFNPQFWINVFMGLVFALLALVALVLLLRAVKEWQLNNTDPSLDVIFQAMLPLLHQAVFNAEKLANDALTTAGAALDGVNRKDVADSLYNLLPDKIDIAGREFSTASLKVLVPREQFEEWVKQVYDASLARFMAQKAYLAKQIEIEIKG